MAAKKASENKRTAADIAARRRSDSEGFRIIKEAPKKAVKGKK